jgi:hypothetical protein
LIQVKSSLFSLVREQLVRPNLDVMNDLTVAPVREKRARQSRRKKNPICGARGDMLEGEADKASETGE